MRIERIHVLCALFIYTCLTNRDVPALLLSLPTLAISANQILRIKTSEFTCSDMFWFCIFIFFGVSPAQSFDGTAFPYSGATRGLQFDHYILAKAHLLVITFISAFAISQNLIEKFRLLSHQEVTVAEPSLGLSRPILFTSIALICFAAYIPTQGGFENVVRSRLDKVDENTHFIGALLLALASVSTAQLARLIKASGRTELGNITMLFLCLIAQGVAVNIFNSPRFILIATWAPLFGVIFARLLIASIIYPLLLVGIFFIMPVLSISTRQGYIENGVSLDSEAPMFFIKDVDIIETLIQAIDHVHRSGHDYGQNLLSIVFFFVPRVIWTSKPLVGGLTIGNELFEFAAAGTPNLSFFIAGDLYLDFGFLGVLLGGLIFGSAFALVTSAAKGRDNINLIQLVLLGSLPILIRGPVGAVIGYPLCLLVMSAFFQKYQVCSSDPKESGANILKPH